MSKLALGSETFPSEPLKDVRLWLRVLLCRINPQLIEASPVADNQYFSEILPCLK